MQFRKNTRTSMMMAAIIRFWLNSFSSKAICVVKTSIKLYLRKKSKQNTIKWKPAMWIVMGNFAFFEFCKNNGMIPRKYKNFVNLFIVSTRASGGTGNLFCSWKIPGIFPTFSFFSFRIEKCQRWTITIVNKFNLQT